MITTSGIYKVTVQTENNPTYLTNGLYDVEVRERGHDIRFTSHTRGSSSYERANMLRIFEEQARVICEPVKEERIIPFWYRGSMHIDVLKGNGKLTVSQEAA